MLWGVNRFLGYCLAIGWISVAIMMQNDWVFIFGVAMLLFVYTAASKWLE